MKNWHKSIPPYEGEEPYLYFAFAQADEKKVWKILRPLLERGCRVWYCFGRAGGADELLRRQERASRAALTLLYLSDEACADKATKTYVLVNQKDGRQILCLDPDGADRRLRMGLREDIVHIPLYKLTGRGEVEESLIHAEGFSQEIIGEPVKIAGGRALARLSALFCLLAILLSALAFAGLRCFHWFTPEITDEVELSDPVIRAGVREAARGGAITPELTDELTELRLDAMPQSWEDLSLLPALERIEIPQQALLDGAPLPEGDYTIELNGGDGP
ncbi:MAG: hypothetical protein IJH48_09475 [Oscillospiraceae bacterium]|nr:hypothetical protein [Oscillospiraceae bacterium]